MFVPRSPWLPSHSPLEARQLGSTATRWQQLDLGMSRRTGAPPQTVPGEAKRGANTFQKKFNQGFNESLEMLKDCTHPVYPSAHKNMLTSNIRVRTH